jgi:aminoglycoside phosphotransferase (APT) family kinase protein
MKRSPTWPEAIDRYLQATYGPATAIERLGGMGPGQVHRARFPNVSVIVKRDARPTEVFFYTTIAPTLRAHDIPIPRLEWSGDADDMHWLIVEDIPRPLPRERWGADPSVLKVLGRLHTLSSAQVQPWPGAFRPEWTKRMTAAALSWFPAAIDDLQPLIGAIQGAHQHLFAPECCISGDPNPTNWGLRDDTSPVLFDWERFGFGTPALDLAITIPGLGDAATFKRSASLYLRERGQRRKPGADAVAQLAHHIGVAKMWSVVEFLSNAATGALPNSANTSIEYIVRLFPEWAQRIAGSDA